MLCGLGHVIYLVPNTEVNKEKLKEKAFEDWVPIGGYAYDGEGEEKPTKTATAVDKVSKTSASKRKTASSATSKTQSPYTSLILISGIHLYRRK